MSNTKSVKEKETRIVTVFTISLSIVAILSIAIGFYVVNYSTTPPSNITELSVNNTSSTIKNRIKAQSFLNSIDPLFQSNLIKLLNQYRDDINIVRVQVSLLEVRDYVISFYPTIGKGVFTDTITQVFPEYAQRILETLKKMDEYNLWIMKNDIRLSELRDIDSDREIWSKRTELFKKDAYEIWSGKLTSYEQRKQSARDMLENIEKSETMTNSEKLYQLTNSLENIYGQTIEGFSVNKKLISSLYLGVKSVQKELVQLEPEQRQDKINSIRRQIGYSDEQIEKMQRKDEYRNKRWDNGLTYMAERKLLEGRYSGVDLDYRLDALREQYFKHEAKTIAAEEDGGFFRYLRPRIIGRN